jgi:hypothetical protein
MFTQYGNASSLLSVKLVVEEHIAGVLDTVSIVQHSLDFVVDGTDKAQKGVLQHQVITPGLLLSALTRSSPSFPPDTMPPIPLSKDSIHMLYHICDVRAFIRKGVPS